MAFKVNIHYNVLSDSYSAIIVKNNNNDYSGQLYGTHYIGLGSDNNYYGAFVGSRKECEDWVKNNNNNFKNFC